MHTDPIADMLTRIRNACMIQHTHVVMPSSKVKVNIAQILQQEGFISRYAVNDDKPQPKLMMELKYTGRGKPVITGLKRRSRPGRRLYTGYSDIPWVRSGLGINILSTPMGVMTGRKARNAKVGGEVLCDVW